LPIIQGDGYSVESLDWDGFDARIKRQDTVNGFIINFLLMLFASADTRHNGKFRAIAASIGDVELTNFDVTINDDVEIDAIAKFDLFFIIYE
jgi:hypothetical protein